MKLTKKLIVVSLLLGLAGGVTGSARAGEDQPAPAPTPANPEAPTPPPAPAPASPEAPTPPETPAPKATKPVEQQLNGRVVAVDKTARTITIQVNNQTYVLKTADDTKFTKAGKTKTLDDLLVGEDVTVTVALRETAAGRVEIAVVAVELPTLAEAQGGRGLGPANLPPFVNLPNPANVGGRVVSPSN